MAGRAVRDAPAPARRAIRRAEFGGGGQARDRCRASAGHDAIIAAGGDGTVNLALNAIMDPATDRPRSPQVALGAIGLGSSNDFHKSGAPQGCLAGAPARVDVAGAAAVDVGKATVQLPGKGQLVRYFLLNASMGLVADGNHAFNTSGGLIAWLKLRNVDLAIAACAVHAVAALRLPHVAVTSDGWGYDGPIANIGVLKSVYFAGACATTPRSSVTTASSTSTSGARRGDCG